MSDEAKITNNLFIRKVNSAGDVVQLEYQARPSAFQGDVDGTKGPVPGALNVPSTGKIVNLEELVRPGYYRIMNLDATYFFEYGLRDPQTNVFYPWGEVLPGESYVGRFSRNLLEEYTGTGTGTTEATNQVFLKAEPAAGSAGINALLEAFEA